MNVPMDKLFALILSRDVMGNLLPPPVQLKSDRLRHHLNFSLTTRLTTIKLRDVDVLNIISKYKYEFDL